MAAPTSPPPTTATSVMLPSDLTSMPAQDGEHHHVGNRERVKVRSCRPLRADATAPGEIVGGKHLTLEGRGFSRVERTVVMNSRKRGRLCPRVRSLWHS